MKVIIRADGNPEIGIGHINRCAVLADAFVRKGIECRLICMDNLSARSFLAQKAYAVFISDEDEFYSSSEADVCIVDKYDYSGDYYKNIKSDVILIYDDVKFEAPAGVKGVINHQVYASQSDYSVRSFCGLQYYTVREEFHSVSRKKNAENIFLCMGGSDPEGQTKRLGSLLKNITKRKIDVIFGPGYLDWETRELFGSDPAFNAYNAPANLAEIMSECIAAVSGAGGMLYELAAVGVPAAAVVLSDDQKTAAGSFAEKGLCINCGHFTNMTDESFTESFKLLESDNKLLDQMSRKCRMLIDGGGADRLVSDIIQWVKYEVFTR